MPLDVNIDDNNTTLILYQGSWTYRPGSTRQWEGGIHATGQAGASAAFNFRGYKVWVLGTIPAGAGTNIITISIDGDTSSNISRTSNGSANYDEVYFSSPLLRDTYHSIVVTNRGSTSTGESEFMLDRFEFQTEDEVPSFSTFPSATSVSSSTRSTTSVSPSTRSATLVSSTSSATLVSSTSSATSVSSTRSSSTNTPSPSSSSSTIPWGGIIGAIASCFLIVIFVLLFLLWRKRRTPNKTLPGSAPLSPFTPTPFPTSSELSTSDSATRRILPTLLTKKASYQQSGVEPASTPTAFTLSPSASAGPSPFASSSPMPLLVNPHASHSSETYDGPPPSYQQKTAF